MIFPSKFRDPLNFLHTPLGGPMEINLRSPALGGWRKDNSCTVSCEEELVAGRKTGVWFLFQELFTEMVKSGSSLFLLVLSQQPRVGLRLLYLV